MDDVRLLLVRAKTEYQRALSAIDVRLLAAIRADVKLVPKARAIQESYLEGFTVTPMTILLQPKAPVKVKPRKRVRRPVAKSRKR